MKRELNDELYVHPLDSKRQCEMSALRFSQRGATTAVVKL